MDSTSLWSITLPTEQHVWSKEAASHTWTLSICLCMGSRYLRGLIYFWARMVSSTKQEMGGETSTISQPKVLPSWLVAHNWPPEELQYGLPHLFRGLNITSRLEN